MAGGSRPNTGGKRKGAGRKSKAEEMGLPKLMAKSVSKKDWIAIFDALKAQAIAGSKAHAELLMAYNFGRPVQNIDHTTKGDKLQSAVVSLNLSTGSDDEGQE